MRADGYREAAGCFQVYFNEDIVDENNVCVRAPQYITQVKYGCWGGFSTDGFPWDGSASAFKNNRPPVGPAENQLNCESGRGRKTYTNNGYDGALCRGYTSHTPQWRMDCCKESGNHWWTCGDGACQPACPPTYAYCASDRIGDGCGGVCPMGTGTTCANVQASSGLN